MSHMNNIEDDNKKDEAPKSEIVRVNHSITRSGALHGQPFEEVVSALPLSSATPIPTVRSSSEIRKSASVRRHVHFGRWWWEISAALLGLISTVLIITILVFMDGKPLRKWKTAAVQPHSLVSIFSTIAKTALLVSIAECLGQLKWIYFEKRRRLQHFQTFDEASRGPWGATKLILYTKGTAGLATLGATGIIFMLAFEPFAQQVIQYVERYSELNALNGMVGISYSWANINLSQSVTNNSLSYRKNLYEPLVMGITSALLEQPVDIIPNAYCPYSACNLTSYDSLGVCSHCDTENISNSYFDTCKYGFREQQEYFNRSEFFDSLEKMRANNMTQGFAFADCRKRVSFNRILGIHAFWNMTTTNLWFTATDPEIIVYGDAGWEPVTQKENFTSDRFRFCIYEDWNDDPTRNQMDPRLPPEGGPRRRRRAFFTTDPQSMTMIANAFCFTLNINPSLWLNGGRFGEINGTVTNCRLEFCAHQFNHLEIRNGNKRIGSTDQLPLTVAGSASTSNYTFTTPMLPNRVYTIGIQSRESLVYMFHSIAERKNKDRYQFDFMIRPQDWPSFFDRLAAALTNVIQSPLNPHAENITTVAYGMETYVTVRWGWMTLPLALVCMSILFLCLTILKGRKRGYLFKTSLLPVLSQGGGEWSEVLQKTGRTADETLTYQDLEKNAEGERAAFTEDSQGRYRLERKMS